MSPSLLHQTHSQGDDQIWARATLERHLSFHIPVCITKSCSVPSMWHGGIYASFLWLSKISCIQKYCKTTQVRQCHAINSLFILLENILHFHCWRIRGKDHKSTTLSYWLLLSCSYSRRFPVSNLKSFAHCLWRAWSIGQGMYSSSWL